MRIIQFVFAWLFLSLASQGFASTNSESQEFPELAFRKALFTLESRCSGASYRNIEMVGLRRQFDQVSQSGADVYYRFQFHVKNEQQRIMPVTIDLAEYHLDVAYNEPWEVIYVKAPPGYCRDVSAVASSKDPQAQEAQLKATNETKEN